ncbi:MAG TPA: DNA-formamidopyrimidine glycosylase family protein [Actinomycetota bacterium]|nr:DNA-formamidopyrimidine glycosylase family protein [Actinomycetota bacterium]
MPEGDTIFKAAQRFREALAGKRVVRLAIPVHGAGAPAADVAVDASVTTVESHGKHLWIAFDDGRALHVHLGMHGVAHVVGPGSAVPKSARAVIDVGDAIAICRRAPVVELLDARRMTPRHLGPDLLDPAPDIDEAVRRARLLDPSTPVGVALLDQRVAAGIGNVYKSEVLFARRVDPFARIGDLTDGTLGALLRTAAAMLAANVGPGRRTTVPGGLAVYRRAGRACLRCRTLIRSQRLGEHARSTYWCPACQTVSE